MSVEEATLEAAFLGMIGDLDERTTDDAKDRDRSSGALPPGRIGGLT
ncbi:MAG TPA: hypothetical protein VMV28_01990 [Thermoplasmata archaeon]|nr:hypothetical protein [Thermoplasmata archaeon]